MSEELTYNDVALHNVKEDLYVVIHDKIYNVTPFIDEHPGGEEVLLDAGGQDATEAFEDVGHSDEARESLVPLYVGKLKRLPGDPVWTAKGDTSDASQTSSGGIFGVGVYALLVIGGVAAYFGYQYLQQQQQQQQAV